MRCLYCGKELALLKRLRGGGDFCSDAHKQSYQEEYNRLALSRLLQAQKKGQQANNSSAQNAAPPGDATLALEEPVPEDVARGAAAAPALETELTETLTQATSAAVSDSVAVEESPTEAAMEAGASVGAEPEPLETASFLAESFAIVALPEETPYLESWAEPAAGPAMSEWQPRNGALSLSSAGLVSLDLRPKASSMEYSPSSATLSAPALASAQPNPALSSLANAKKIAYTNRLPASSVIAIDIAPSSGATDADRSFEHPVGFETTVLFDDPQLLELSPTAIDFPAGDSGVVVHARSRHDDSALQLPPFVLSPLPDEPEAPLRNDSPRASLEALSRLHQELVEEETARAPDAVHIEGKTPDRPAAETMEVPVEVMQAAAVGVIASLEADSNIVELAPEMVQPEAVALKPRCATELFEISIKTFPPAKPALIGGDALPTQIAPLLPHLKSLPLRPKIALATGYVPPSTPADTKSPRAAAAHTPSPSKTAAAVKPAARLTQPKQPTQSPKPAQAPAAKAPEPAATESLKAASPKAEATKPIGKPVASQTTAVQESSAAKANISELAPKNPPAEKEQASKATPAANQRKPAADQRKPATSQTKPEADQAKKDNVPNFGLAQPANIPWLGSLKVKLGLAIALLVVACVYFLGWGGGKSRKSAGSNPAVSADGSGPSIIMGEGGWVEGWGGDPIGMHAGRQITIYRPSLKLSDYRLEFQASIDTKSVGWVFRAADPENYYAMKLMAVSSGLSSKIALFKYLVANGRQTQVGRVPIDMALQPDTIFDVRVDVRGPQFTTYIQGQQVDSWTDDQLKIGGAGFLNEREERGKVKAVSIRYLSGGAK